MKNVMVNVILLGTISSCFLSLPQFLAQGCQDEEGMVVSYKKDLVGLVEITRKEGQSDFDKAYHQKACLTKLSFCLNMVNEFLSCQEKAGADPATVKDQADANKTKRDAYAKFKEKLENYRKSLKGTDDSKAAKALIEKFEFPE